MQIQINIILHRATAAVNFPYVSYLEDNCTSNNCFKGMYADLWHGLSKQMNFTYEIKKETVWGVLENGFWKGIIGEIIFEQIHYYHTWY